MKAVMTDKQSTPASFDIFDQDGQLITVLPVGATVSYESTNPEVAAFQPVESQFKGRITSGKVGLATIRGEAQFQDGKVYVSTIEVEVTNSGPSSAQFTVGQPVDEDAAAGDGSPTGDGGGGSTPQEVPAGS